MAVLLIAVVGFVLLAAIVALAAAVRRRYGRAKAVPDSMSRQLSEAEVIIRTGGPFV